jgi:hypothetical protein
MSPRFSHFIVAAVRLLGLIPDAADAGEQVTINPQVREALNLIIASPSPKVSTLIRQHRRLERMGNGKAPSLAFSPARTHTYSNGQRSKKN